MTEYLTVTNLLTEPLSIMGTVFRPGIPLVLGVEDPSTAPEAPYGGGLNTGVDFPVITWAADFLSCLGNAQRKGWVSLSDISAVFTDYLAAAPAVVLPPGDHEGYGSPEGHAQIVECVGQITVANPEQTETTPTEPDHLGSASYPVTVTVNGQTITVNGHSFQF
jgi:hypothetical protein